jgi:hypothetical protein
MSQRFIFSGDLLAIVSLACFIVAPFQLLVLGTRSHRGYYDLVQLLRWVGLESSLPARNFISINSTSTTILKVVYCSKSRVLNKMIAGPKAENGVKVDF